MHRCVFGPFGLILISDPPGAGHAFPRQRHMRRGGYLFLSGFSSLYDAIHGWMTIWMDEWTGHVMKKVSRSPLLYVIFLTLE